MKLYKILYTLTLFFLLSVFTSGIWAQERSKIVFTPQWQPQAQFAGYYVALEQGYYSEAGLDVTIKHPSATADIFQILTRGEADIVSAFLLHGIKATMQGAPIKHFAQMLQHSSLMIVTHKDSGIDEIDKLNGKKLGIWSSGFDELIFALLEHSDIDVEVVRILNTINLFLEGGVDAISVMHYNEYDQIINSGIDPDELNTFFMRDFSLNIPEDALYCMDTTWENRTEEMQAFAEATIKGWKYASNNKEYAIDLVVNYMKRANLPNNKVHQTWMLEKVLEAIEPGIKPVQKGQLSKEDYTKAISIIK
ncbi:MAG: ABC transporter substrate-binding protein [Bacteroidales bacterium]|nr:ABC transporter substrate-binding protein [Bacteroidales bacterium]